MVNQPVTQNKGLDELQAETTEAAFSKLVTVIKQLRDPKDGCPWDIKQTHQSLKPYLLEESYEVLEAIDQLAALPKNQPNGLDLMNESSMTERVRAQLADELGDVLLQVLLHAQIADEAGTFNVKTVIDGLTDKMIRRHPHVFGDVEVEGADEVVTHWEAIKAIEKGIEPSNTSDASDTMSSILDSVSEGLPTLLRATKLSKKAVKHGFKWPNDASLWDCVMSEFDEFKEECEATPPIQDRLEDEMGDILFASVSLANHYGVNPDVAMAKANAKFTRRFKAMEQLTETPLTKLSFEAWDTLWKQAKKKT